MKIFDMHCDTFSELYKDQSKQLYQNNLAIDILKLQQGNYKAQCFAMFVPFTLPNLFQTCDEMIKLFKQQIQANHEYIEQGYTYQDIIDINEKGKIAAILTIEESAVIENDLDNLEYFYNLGVRMMTLTWNYYNGIGYPNDNFENKNQRNTKISNTHDGLTEFGIKCVQKMNELGIIIDVSHLSDNGVYDVLKNSSKPFVASHSNARSVYNHCRNLSDDLIDKMAKKGCVIGVNYYADFLSNQPIGQIKDIVKHIQHIVKIGGIHCVGLGSDYDGIPDNLEMKNCSLLPLLVHELENQGFTNEEIEKICYKNVLRIFKENL